MSYLVKALNRFFLFSFILTLSACEKVEIDPELVKSESFLAKEGRICFVSPLLPENTISVENPQVCRYLDETQYLYGFTGSLVTQYAVESGYRMDYPSGYSIALPDTNGGLLSIHVRTVTGYPFSFSDVVSSSGGVYEIKNLIPGNLYHYEVKSENNSLLLSDSIFATGQVRMIYSENGLNVRDIGGWRTRDGSRIQYGRIYRGAAYSRGFTKRDVAIINDQLGIKAEIDLRSDAELNLDDENPNNDLNHSVFGDRISYYHYPMPLTDFIYKDDVYVGVFRTVLSSLRHGKNIYIHCAGGADRTGTIFLMLEALLGVDDSDMAKDYELTSFAPNYYNKNNYRLCSSCLKTFNYFSQKTNFFGTSKEITEHYMLSLGVTEDEINEFRRIMLVDFSADY